MAAFQKYSLFALRVATGWTMFYAGITKLLDPNWSAAGYLKAAQTFPGFFQWFASPGVLPVTNFLNEWGLTLIGAALILGIFVRIASFSSAGLMVLYYLPVLSFPYIAPYSFIVDEHFIYALVFLVLAAFRAGRWLGLENWCSNLPTCSKVPKLRAWLG